MSKCPVFVTAAIAGSKVPLSDHPVQCANFAKAVNRAFLLLHDFEFSSGPPDSQWVVLTSTTLPDSAPNPTSLPVPGITTNDFANCSLSDINKFVRSHEAELENIDLSDGLWLVIDQIGLDTNTCLVVEQSFVVGEFDDDKIEYTKEFRAARLPYEEVWSMHINLFLANMDFEDWADVDAGVQADGTLKWVGSFSSSNEALDRGKVEAAAKREKALKALRDLGHVE